MLISLYDITALGVKTLHSVLTKQGFDVKTIFFKKANLANKATEDEIKGLVNIIKDVNPDIVGISVMSTLYKLASKITSEIKNETSAKVIWGGIHPTILPEECLEHADMVCIGEGEKPILELAKKLSANQKIENIKNLWVKQSHKIIKNELNPLIEDLDSVSFADYLGVNMYYFDNNNIDQNIDRNFVYDNAYRIMTSRGCPFSCTYCCNNVLRKIYHKKGRYVRRRSVDNVIKELIIVKRKYKNLNLIEFFDDVFTFDKKWLSEFCLKYKQQINVPFFCYVHPQTTDEETILMLKDAGFKHTTIGIQSGSENMRKNYFKRFDSNDEIIRLVKILHNHKINIHYDIILSTPFEAEEDKRETLKLLLSFPRPFGIHHFSMTFFPRTEFTDMCLKGKKISEKDVEGEKQSCYGKDTSYVIPLDQRRSKEDLFYDILYYLAKKRWPSRKTIMRLSKSNLLRKYPNHAAFILRLITYDPFYSKSRIKKTINLGYRFFYYMAKRDFNSIRRYIRAYIERNNISLD